MLFSLITTFCLFFPDLFLGHTLNLISARLSFGVFISFLVSMFWLSGLKSRTYCLVFLWLAQSFQIGHWLYFGLPIHSHDIPKLWQEVGEILDTAKGVSYDIWAPFLVTLSITALGFIVAARLPFKKITFAFVPLMIMPFYFWFKGPKMFYIQIISPSAYATIRAVSNFFVHGFKQEATQKFKPYTLTYDMPLYKKIVLIFGESMNPDFSYNAIETPFLFSLKPAWRIGYSAAVTTIESLEYFFNVIGEKGNTRLWHSQTVNLFRLAKHQGYYTTFLSAQNTNLLSRCGLSFCDTFVSAEAMNLSPSHKTDEKLLSFVQKISWKEKHFVALHVRHAHSPYNDFFKGKVHGKDRREKTINAYKKAMQYHDNWLKRLFSILPKDVQVVFVSDHGEMMGEEGFYGHSFEYPGVHRIPVWSYPAVQLPKTHYEIGKMIARWLGVKIQNPNEKN